jgi:hypothetical protein
MPALPSLTDSTKYTPKDLSQEFLEQQQDAAAAAAGGAQQHAVRKQQQQQSGGRAVAAAAAAAAAGGGVIHPDATVQEMSHQDDQGACWVQVCKYTSTGACWMQLCKCTAWIHVRCKYVSMQHGYILGASKQVY